MRIMFFKFNIFMLIIFVLAFSIAIISLIKVSKDLEKMPGLVYSDYEDKVTQIHANRIKWIVSVWVVVDIALMVFG